MHSSRCSLCCVHIIQLCCRKELAGGSGCMHSHSMRRLSRINCLLELHPLTEEEPVQILPRQSVFPLTLLTVNFSIQSHCRILTPYHLPPFQFPVSLFLSLLFRMFILSALHLRLLNIFIFPSPWLSFCFGRSLAYALNSQFIGPQAHSDPLTCQSGTQLPKCFLCTVFLP